MGGRFALPLEGFQVMGKAGLLRYLLASRARMCFISERTGFGQAF